MDNILHSILCRSGQDRSGLNNCAEARALLAEHFTDKPYSLVEEWVFRRRQSKSWRIWAGLVA